MNKRRTLLKLSGAAYSFGLCKTSKAQVSPKPKIYLLLHGALHGGWCWIRVSQELRQAGNRVLTPTLTGLGERSHLLTKEVSVEKHVQDILNVLRWERLHEVTLVAHSYSGLIASIVADRARSQISKMVFLDALLPRNGETWADLYSSQQRDGMLRLIEGRGDGWKIPVSGAQAFGVKAPDDIDWVDALLTPHPARTFTDACFFSEDRLRTLPRTYISCTTPELPTIRSSKERAQADPEWQYREMSCGHDAMVIALHSLVDILLEI